MTQQLLPPFLKVLPSLLNFFDTASVLTTLGSSTSLLSGLGLLLRVSCRLSSFLVPWWLAHRLVHSTLSHRLAQPRSVFPDLQTAAGLQQVLPPRLTLSTLQHVPLRSIWHPLASISPLQVVLHGGSKITHLKIIRYHLQR